MIDILTGNWYWGVGVAAAGAAWFAWRKWKKRGKAYPVEGE